MKNKIKNIIITLSFVLFMIAMIGGNPIRSEAKVKDGTYNFSSCMVTKFQVKNNRLTLKVSKDDTSGITKTNDENYKKYKLTVKVSKNCKYRWEEFQRMTGESNSGKSNYRKVKKSIAEDRAFYKQSGNYNNVGLSRIVVKNNQVVKLVHLYA